MTREEKERFSVVDHDGSVLASMPLRRLAIDRARQEARKRGYEIEIVDTMAVVGSVLRWVVNPSGTVQAIELRSVETEPRAPQSGDTR